MIGQTQDATSIPFQVCIVGAGPVGLALAFRLEEQGICVLLVEAGQHDNGALLEDVTNRHHAPPVSSMASGLGGTSSLWGGRCVAFDDIDFLKRPHVPNSGWPISHDDISRYYADALRLLNVKDPDLTGTGARLPGGDVHADAIEWWSSRPDLGTDCREKIGKSRLIHFLPDTSATSIYLDAMGAATHVQLDDGRGSVRVSVGKLVLAAGGIGNARLLHQLGKKYPEKLSRSLGRYYQGHLTGYIAVIELENDATVDALSFQITPGGSVFRRRFQLSGDAQQRLGLLNCVFWLDSISISNAAHHSAGFSFLFLVLQLTGLYRFLANGQAAGSHLRRGVLYRDHFCNLVPSLRALNDLGHTLSQLARRCHRKTPLVNPARRYMLRYHAEQIPDPTSTVMPCPSRDGDHLAPVAIDYRVCEKDLESIEKSHVVLDQWLRANRVGMLHYLHTPSERRQALRDQAYDGFHQIGLTRMAASSEKGVVDRDCKVHNVDNLYVAGSCIFPTGGHANPTMPAVALAMRLADHLVEKMNAARPAQQVAT
ncbi:GMC oxidoreductase [Agrobacterium tumefaciens]|uniref:GMC family oxidoreductase n=1 Tax=Agrobacterium tumefaciens TaxID=358 RepID=A0A4D7YKT6_AGRTU|nr:GMC oxidoreductase [Agrobacterium tumefaciens]QCL97951.1 GMC family oxidoreductase [Agrobacterium tumefaciens]